MGFEPIEQPEKPPFDLLTDVLLLASLVPTAPIRNAYPGLPLLSMGGRTLPLAWLAQVDASSYRDAGGRSHCTAEHARVGRTMLRRLRGLTHR
jgi:hypothetical protein